MSKVINHFYVLVFTEEGPIYVTSLDYITRYAHWERLEKPYEMDKNIASNIVLGLNLNGYLAQVVMSKWEIDNQPYRYSVGKLKFVKEEKDVHDKEFQDKEGA